MIKFTQVGRRSWVNAEMVIGISQGKDDILTEVLISTDLGESITLKIDWSPEQVLSALEKKS